MDDERDVIAAVLRQVHDAHARLDHVSELVDVLRVLRQLGTAVDSATDDLMELRNDRSRRWPAT